MISPVLCNVYLHRLDRQWAEARTGVLCATRTICWRCARPNRKPRTPSRRSPRSWRSWALELKQAKTRIVHLREGGEGFDFLGFHHRYVRGNTPRSRHLTFLVRWPSRQAMQHARQRVREITARERLLLPVEEIVRGPQPVPARLGGLLPLRKLRPVLRQDHAPRDQPAGRSSSPTATNVDRRFGWWVVARQSPDRIGLIDLNGTIVPPRPTRPRHRGR